MKKITLALLFAGLCAFAEVSFDEKSNTIHIEGVETGLKSLVVSDRMNGWNKIKKTSEGYTIDANVQIGKLEGEDSVLNINENVTVNGDVTVAPNWIKGVSASKTPGGVKKRTRNVLNLNPDGVLKLADGKTLLVGYLPDHIGKWAVDGEFNINGGKLTASSNKWGGKKYICFNPLSVYRWKNGEISRFDGTIKIIAARYGKGFLQIENMVFSDGGNIIISQYHGKNAFVGCTFRKMGNPAIVDYGSLNAVFKNCKFEGNIRNFALRFGPGVTLIDCKVAPGKAPDTFAIPKPAKNGVQIIPEMKICKTVENKIVTVDVKKAAK